MSLTGEVGGYLRISFRWVFVGGFGSGGLCVFNYDVGAAVTSGAGTSAWVPSGSSSLLSLAIGHWTIGTSGTW